MSDTHCAIGTQLQPSANLDITHSRHSGYLYQTINWNLSSSKAIKQAIDNDTRSLETGYSQFIIEGNKCIYHLNTILYPWRDKLAIDTICLKGRLIPFTIILLI